MMIESQGTKNFPATRESLGLKDSAWDEAQGTTNWSATRDLPSLCPECDGGEVILCGSNFVNRPPCAQNVVVAGLGGLCLRLLLASPFLLACQEFCL